MGNKNLTKWKGSLISSGLFLGSKDQWLGTERGSLSSGAMDVVVVLVLPVSADLQNKNVLIITENRCYLFLIHVLLVSGGPITLVHVLLYLYPVVTCSIRVCQNNISVISWRLIFFKFTTCSHTGSMPHILNISDSCHLP